VDEQIKSDCTTAATLDNRTINDNKNIDELTRWPKKDISGSLGVYAFTLRSCLFSAHLFSFLADVKQGEFPFGAVVLLTPSLEMTCFGISLFM
jgi:hypothetical protein